MTRNGIVISDNGILTNPNVHDAQLIGLFTCESGSTIVFIIKSNGKNICLSLSGVEQFKCDNFRHGNIILDITIETGAAASIDDILLLFDIDNNMNNVFFEKILARFESRELTLVKLNPSYGCSFLCACKTVELISDCLNYIFTSCLTTHGD